MRKEVEEKLLGGLAFSVPYADEVDESEEEKYMITDGCYTSIISAKDESEAIDKYLVVNETIIYPKNFYVNKIIW